MSIKLIHYSEFDFSIIFDYAAKWIVKFKEKEICNLQS